MAIHNYVFVYAQVLQAPHIKINDDTDEYERGLCAVCVIRNSRNVGDEADYLRKDKPVVLTFDPKIIKEMENWKENDLVQIKGTIATKSVVKRSICDCGHENLVEGDMFYINPIFASKCASAPSNTKAIEELKEKKEISNQVFLIGRLCKEPKKIVTKAGVSITQYPIAINRKYKNKNESVNTKTDYPWIKSYGENAIEDRKRLHTNSLVYIDGMIQARSIKRTTTCEDCNKKYVWDDKTMEVVPYEVEYLNDYYSDEDLDKIRQAEVDRIRNDLHKNISNKTENVTLENNKDEKITNSDNVNKIISNKESDEDFILSEEDKIRFEYGSSQYDEDEDEDDEEAEEDDDLDED